MHGSFKVNPVASSWRTRTVHHQEVYILDSFGLEPLQPSAVGINNLLSKTENESIV